MFRNNIVHRSLVACFTSAAFAFHSPAGHDALHQMMVRAWFTPLWIEVSMNEGRFISFQTLREDAVVLAYDPDPVVYSNNLRLLGSTDPYCRDTTALGEGEQDNDGEQSLIACHAVCTRKTDKKGLHI